MICTESAKVRADTNHGEAGGALRLADLAPLRRVLDSNSLVLRVEPDGQIVAYEQLPSLFLSNTMRTLLTADERPAFEAACLRAVKAVRQVVHESADGEQVVLTPVLADHADTVLFVVCWVRAQRREAESSQSLALRDLRPSEIEVRYRLTQQEPRRMLEIAPWWVLEHANEIELWPLARQIAAIGMAPTVMATLLHGAVEQLMALGIDDVDLRVTVPQADFLGGLLPTLNGSLRASGLAPHRVVFAVPVSLAVEADLLPMLVHLQTMGVQIDVVGLHALTAQLHAISDTSDHRHDVPVRALSTVGTWTSDMSAALCAHGVTL